MTSCGDDQRSEQIKSTATEAKASNLADTLVPFTFAGSLLSFALTRNVTRALSVLMVDFSCALKLAMPLAVLSAMREAGRAHHRERQIPGRAVAKADTIVFDKTGTLTHACPRVAEVVPFNGKDEAEMLRLALAWEEHFPTPWPTPSGGSPAQGARREAPCHGGVSGGPWDCQFGGWGAGAHWQRPLYP